MISPDGRPAVVAVEDAGRLAPSPARRASPAAAERPSAAPRPGALQACHRWVGFATIAAFLGTGWVLRLHDPPMASLAPGPRMLLRSGHIYILFAGLLNLALGMVGGREVRLGRGRSRIRPWLESAGSLLVVVAAVLLLAGFFVESGSGMLDRPLTAFGIYAAFAGTLLRFFASRGGAG